MLISIVVPVFNEGARIGGNLRRILSAAESNHYSLELVAINDGSGDETASELSKLAESDSRISYLNFTRNFGKEAAIWAGLTTAKGDAVVIIDSDLQHPPELIPRMVQLWMQGISVVSAVKSSRGKENVFSRFTAGTFYWVFKVFAGLDIVGQSDFKLLDRNVVDTLLSFPEKQRFFRGLVDWSGFESARIPFEVASRAGGDSRWGLIKLARYAINNITSFSSLPLKIITVLGVFMLLTGLFIGAVSMYQKIEGVALDGFTTLNMLIIFASGAIMVSLGVIGHYLARIYDEIKARPIYLVQPERRNNK